MQTVFPSVESTTIAGTIPLCDPVSMILSAVTEDSSIIAPLRSIRCVSRKLLMEPFLGEMYSNCAHVVETENVSNAISVSRTEVNLLKLVGFNF